MPDPRIPVLLMIGATGAGKTSLIARLVARKLAGERWGVLVNDFGKATLADVRVADASVVVRDVAGCICCTAQVSLRVALVSLLREARPLRLVIEASSAARTSAVVQVLSQAGVAESVELRRTVCVVQPKQIADARYASNEVYREQIAAADAIVFSGSADETPHARAAVERIRTSPARYFDPEIVELAELG